MTRVSIILPVYNCQAYVYESIASILGQTMGDFELIVIDDCSTDSTSAILSSFRDERIVSLRNTCNLGLVESLNRGIQCSSCELLARMDADDVSYPERLRKQMLFLDHNPTVAVVGTAIENIDASGNAIDCYYYPSDPLVVSKKLLEGCPIAHPTVLMRRDAVLRAGGYRLKIGAEDYDLWLRISEFALLANLREPLLKYRHHTGSLTLTKVENYALGEFAARSAALIRRSGYSDPIPFDGDISRDVLLSLGVDESVRARIVEVSFIDQAKRLLRTAQSMQAEDVVNTLSTRPCLSNSSRDELAMLRLRIACGRCRPVAVPLLLLKGLVKRPRLFLLLVLKVLNVFFTAFNQFLLPLWPY